LEDHSPQELPPQSSSSSDGNRFLRELFAAQAWLASCTHGLPSRRQVTH
jgi:hypothetical protein